MPGLGDHSTAAIAGALAHDRGERVCYRAVSPHRRPRSLSSTCRARIPVPAKRGPVATGAKGSVFGRRNEG